MKIALYDDDSLTIGIIETYLTQKFYKKDDFDFFSSEKKLLGYINKTKERYTIYFISLDTEEARGFSIAKKIRSFDLTALIIFVAQNEQHMHAAFKFYAFDYLIQPLTLEKLTETMQRASNYLHINANYFDFSFNRKTFVLSINDIISITKSGRVAYIHTINQTYKTYLTMPEVLAKLNIDFFVQTHGSYVLNLNYVLEIIKNEVVIKPMNNKELKNSNTIPISRMFKEDLKKAYFDFLTRQ